MRLGKVRLYMRLHIPLSSFSLSCCSSLPLHKQHRRETYLSVSVKSKVQQIKA